MTGFDHQVLNEEFKTENDEEGWIVEQCGKYVDFLSVNNPAVDLVEQIHQNESVEDNCIHNKSVSWFSILVSKRLSNWIEAFLKEDKGTSIHQEEHYNDLESSLNNNLSPDFSQKDLVSSANSVGFSLILLVWLSSNSNGSKNIHDQVGPEHLDNI